MRRALEEVELLVVCDIRRTETTELADVVFPVTSQFERADLNTGLFFPEPYMQYIAPMVAPAGDRKPTSWVFAELSRRMGVPVMGDAALAAGLPEDFTDDDVLEVMAGESRIPWSDRPRRGPRRAGAAGAGAGLVDPRPAPRPPRPRAGAARAVSSRRGRRPSPTARWSSSTAGCPAR